MPIRSQEAALVAIPVNAPVAEPQAELTNFSDGAIRAFLAERQVSPPDIGRLLTMTALLRREYYHRG